MVSPTGPPNLNIENRAYNPAMAGKAKSSKGPRPKQGARLLSLRTAACLTQIELAAFLQVSQANIALWEWSHEPPRSNVLAGMAKAFGVRLEDILVDSAVVPIANRTGPIGEVQKTFEQVRQLPRKQQRKVLDVVNAMLVQLLTAS
jgi:transcriptional regulator with XRE-family HTH domain